MQLLVRGVHIQVTDALREYCEIQMRRALDRRPDDSPTLNSEAGILANLDEACFEAVAAK